MVRVQDEEDVEGALEHGVGFEVPGSHAVEHAEEVARVGELVLRIDVGQPPMMPVCESRQRGHLRDQPCDLGPAYRRIVDLLRLGVEGRQRGDRADHHPHRVRVVAERLQQLRHVLVHIRMERHVVHEAIELVLRRELALEDQVGDLEERAALGELLDRVSAVPEDALPSVDERDRAPRGSSVRVRGVVRHHPEVVVLDLDLAQVHGPDDISLQDVHLVVASGPVVPNGEGVGSRLRVVSHPVSVTSKGPARAAA